MTKTATPMAIPKSESQPITEIKTSLRLDSK
jgi:hypothetical protein